MKTIIRDFRGREVEVMWEKEVVPIGNDASQTFYLFAFG